MHPSDVIDGRYRLERLLGTGGMSEVWLAEDTRLGRWVAVKVLRDTVTQQEGNLVDSIEREARLVARLQHPNIVAVFDVGTWEDHHYLVMEYVHGFSLRQLLQTQGRLPEQEAVRYGAQVAAALQYAHEQGVVHCDVKPENILINEQGVAKIADFGVADTVTRTLGPEQARDILGTIAYLAPEVIQGAPADARSDIYSLGLTVYEMVAGRLPFTGTTAAAIAGQRLATPAPPLRAFAMSATPELEVVLARALALSQHDRYQAAGDLGGALRRVPIIPQNRASTAPVATAATTPRPARRQPTTLVRRGTLPPPPSSGGNTAAVVAAITAVLLALGAGIVAAVILSQDDNKGGASSPTPGTPTAPPTATPTRRPTEEPTPSPTPRPSPSPSPTQTPTRTTTTTATAQPTTPKPPSPSPTSTATSTATATSTP